MILFFYNLALAAALLLGAPWWLWKMATTHKYREGLRRAAGAGSGPACRGARPAERGRSSGCTRSRWARCWPSAGWSASWTAAFPSSRLLISTTTRTGQELARAALRRQSRLLLPARSALGGARVSECAAAPPAHSGRDGVLAQPAQRLLSPRNSGRRGQCAHLRPLLAALPHAAPVVEAASEPAGARAGAERDGCRAAARAGLRAGAGLRGRKSEVRCARRAGGRSHAAAARRWPQDCASSLPAARWRARKRHCSKPGRGCSLPIRNWFWCWLRAIRSGFAQWRAAGEIRDALGQALGLARGRDTC